jgi:hypothetical protein
MSDHSSMPLSEQFRIAAKAWVDLDSAASLLEETKSAVLSQQMAAQGEMPVSRAELNVKASPEWADFVTRMVEARKAANLAKVRLEWLRMRFSEQQSFEATRRAEMKL